MRYKFLGAIIPLIMITSIMLPRRAGAEGWADLMACAQCKNQGAQSLLVIPINCNPDNPGASSESCEKFPNSCLWYALDRRCEQGQVPPGAKITAVVTRNEASLEDKKLISQVADEMSVPFDGSGVTNITYIDIASEPLPVELVIFGEVGLESSGDFIFNITYSDPVAQTTYTETNTGGKVGVTSVYKMNLSALSRSSADTTIRVEMQGVDAMMNITTREFLVRVETQQNITTVTSLKEVEKCGSQVPQGCNVTYFNVTTTYAADGSVISRVEEEVNNPPCNPQTRQCPPPPGAGGQ